MKVWFDILLIAILAALFLAAAILDAKGNTQD
jgi:hypothetical protein